ncbi:TonB-dependent receptor [Lacibacter sediminis]|uniref:TonB-dependent receptor n=1 Tax=Lacibacter sediminis TaxID=2760713 RepID=A0A7G5XBI0_9BACT|nr:TonB-dependent receptor [Lacibacter sediminis]QNA42833.1 TonB-dependent receptor [Lacibacter sediminis]
MRISHLLILITVWMKSEVKAQVTTPTQTIRGRVVDAESQSPVKGATATIEGTLFTAMTDTSGNFVLPGIPVGRQRVQVSFVGYQIYLSDYFILNSAKETDLQITLIEEKKSLGQITITGTRNPKLPVNKYALVSGRSFSAEETQRFAASANDPGRMAMGFPGVQPSRDSRNDIIIRGNNPVGMNWRLEGLDIPNPNHFARRGSSGGGITIFSLSVLDHSDFYTGALAAEYGDVLSGAFDVHFRKGNQQKAEHTFKAGMIGLEFSTEGPIQKGRSSYLVNYRYSFLDILNAFGINLVDERERNKFQDVSFNLAFNNKKNTVQTNIWGMGGYSKENFLAVDDTAQWKQYDDYAVYENSTLMGAFGIAQTIKLNTKSFIKTSIAVMGQQIKWVDDTLTKQQVATKVNDELYNNNRVSATVSFNHKVNTVVNFKAGMYASLLDYKFNKGEWNYTNNSFKPNVIMGEGNSWLLQPYLQFGIKPNSRILINPGVHSMYFALNKQFVIDPRLSVQYRFSAKTNLTAAYGLHSKLLPLGSYFYQSGSSFPNKDLKMMRSHHYILAFDQMLGKKWRFHVEAYRQQLFQIPVVDNIDRTYWILNEMEGYANEPLVSKGKGTNTGVDLSLEKFFSKGLFMIASFSVFDSKFIPLDGKSYNTRFNSRTSASWVGAKEWKLKKNKVLQAGWKVLYNGGVPLSPLAAVQNGSSRQPVLDETKPYSEYTDAYFRTDGRISLRKDKKKISWQLALDIQNLFAQKNIDPLGRRYDPTTNQWTFKQQSGIVPVLSYQVDF